jgi:DNA-directed RNA polymerase subunit RPC12/RpoP
MIVYRVRIKETGQFLDTLHGRWSSYKRKQYYETIGKARQALSQIGLREACEIVEFELVERRIVVDHANKLPTAILVESPPDKDGKIVESYYCMRCAEKFGFWRVEGARQIQLEDKKQRCTACNLFINKSEAFKENTRD